MVMFTDNMITYNKQQKGGILVFHNLLEALLILR